MWSWSFFYDEMGWKIKTKTAIYLNFRKEIQRNNACLMASSYMDTKLNFSSITYNKRSLPHGLI